MTSISASEVQMGDVITFDRFDIKSATWVVLEARNVPGMDETSLLLQLSSGYETRRRVVSSSLVVGKI